MIIRTSLLYEYGFVSSVSYLMLSNFYDNKRQLHIINKTAILKLNKSTTKSFCTFSSVQLVLKILIYFNRSLAFGERRPYCYNFAQTDINSVLMTSSSIIVIINACLGIIKTDINGPLFYCVHFEFPYLWSNIANVPVFRIKYKWTNKPFLLKNMELGDTLHNAYISFVF